MQRSVVFSYLSNGCIRSTLYYVQHSHGSFYGDGLLWHLMWYVRFDMGSNVFHSSLTYCSHGGIGFRGFSVDCDTSSYFACRFHNGFGIIVAQFDRFWHPLRGLSIGEASHPGPGRRTTAREEDHLFGSDSESDTAILDDLFLMADPDDVRAPPWYRYSY